MKFQQRLRHTIEYDLILFFLFIVPLVVYLTLGQTCEYLNEGMGASGCALGQFGTELAENSFMYFTMLSFGGFLIVLPLVAYAFGKSWSFHYKLWKNNELSLFFLLFSVPGLAVMLIISGGVILVTSILLATAQYWLNQL